MNDSKRLATAFFTSLLLLLPATALTPGKSQTLTSPEQVPEGLSAAVAV